jgi:polyribonucleotide nucleotidyltransferase
MGSVCASSLSLMDAGVPISAPVAGIAMGLISLDGQFVTLTDILGAEDALGDMDFKVAGTADVITALQLDTKIEGLPSEVLSGALDQAKEARLAILEVMAGAIAAPRPELNPTAPRIETLQIPKDKIGEVIGPKGKTIRELEAETGATIEIEEEGAFGIVRVASTDREAQQAAIERIQMIANPPEAEVGKEYDGEVVSVMPFGAFINVLPGRDGLLHISKIDAARRVEKVEDYLNLGDKVKVIVSEIDRNGKLSLLPAEPIMGPDGPSEVPDPNAPKPEKRERRDDRGGNRGGGGGGGGRDRDRGGRGGGNRDRGGRGGDNRDGGNRGGGGNRNRDNGGSRDGGDNRNRNDDGGDSQPQRKVVSFEEDFESGI